MLASKCRAQYYVPEFHGDLRGCGFDPLLPFGACQCTYFEGGSGSRGVVTEPCSTAHLAAGYGVGGADGSPSDEDMVVEASGGTTVTRFSTFTVPDHFRQPESSYDATVTFGTTPVSVALTFFPGLVVESDNVEEDNRGGPG